MLVIKEYNRLHAVEYARRWALARNPLFFDFKGYGGDCTNFISQCIYAGCCEMNFTPIFGWYYRTPDDRSAAWTGVEYFNNFITANEGVGPFAHEATAEEAELGDIIQLADDTGDFYHTLIITGIRDGEIYVSAHTNDVYNRKLSSYTYAFARYLHIDGIRADTAENRDRNCFFRIIGGIPNSTEREIGGENSEYDMPTETQ